MSSNEGILAARTLRWDEKKTERIELSNENLGVEKLLLQWEESSMAFNHLPQPWCPWGQSLSSTNYLHVRYKSNGKRNVGGTSPSMYSSMDSCSRYVGHKGVAPLLTRGRNKPLNKSWWNETNGHGTNGGTHLLVSWFHDQVLNARVSSQRPRMAGKLLRDQMIPKWWMASNTVNHEVSIQEIFGALFLSSVEDLYLLM